MKILSHLSPYFRTSFLTREFFLENNSVAHFIVHLYLFISIYYFTTTTPPSMMSRFVRGIRTWTRTSAVHSDVGHQINSTAVSARISRIQLDLHRSQLVQHKHQRVSGEKLPRFLSAHSSSNSRGNLSSIRDPDPSLFLDRTATLSNVKSVAASSPSSLDGNHVAEGRSTSTTNLAEVTQSDQMDALLRNDVRTMGAVLGRAIQDHSGEDVFNKVEKLRSLAKVR